MGLWLLKKLGVGVKERARRSGGLKNENPAWGIIFGAARYENHGFGVVGHFIRSLRGGPAVRKKHVLQIL